MYCVFSFNLDISKALKPESLRLCIAIAGGEVRFQLPSSNMSLTFWNEKDNILYSEGKEIYILHNILYPVQYRILQR